MIMQTRLFAIVSMLVSVSVSGCFLPGEGPDATDEDPATETHAIGVDLPGPGIYDVTWEATDTTCQAVLTALPDVLVWPKSSDDRAVFSNHCGNAAPRSVSITPQPGSDSYDLSGPILHACDGSADDFAGFVASVDVDAGTLTATTTSERIKTGEAGAGAGCVTEWTLHAHLR